MKTANSAATREPGRAAQGRVGSDRLRRRSAQISGEVEIVSMPVMRTEPLIETTAPSPASIRIGTLAAEHRADHRAAHVAHNGRCLIRITPTAAGPTEMSG